MFYCLKKRKLITNSDFHRHNEYKLCEKQLKIPHKYGFTLVLWEALGVVENLDLVKDYRTFELLGAQIKGMFLNEILVTTNKRN